MEKAIHWFHQQGDIKLIRLYTQDFNVSALHLYKKFGFQVKGTSWHYFVPFKAIQPLGKYSCFPVNEEEIPLVAKRYPNTMPVTQIRTWIERGMLILKLVDSLGNLMGATRFSPDFPGAFPFELKTVDAFDDFIAGIRQCSLPHFDYTRVTFNDNLELADFLKHRNYKLHHRLKRMELRIMKK